jgi:4-diphosphocytidyl-2-C-methyl-D-erythritol kinase
MPTEVFAPAKINLTLHVTGQRSDGYHLLDSLIVFAEAGDVVTVEPAAQTSLTVTGPFAADVPSDGENLVLRAARLMGEGQAHITLAKHLPVASGIGGGSADAAATLRALAMMRRSALPPRDGVLTLGADVPACLESRAARMMGVGEVLHPLAHPLPTVSLVLVNPGRTLSTPEVFAALHRRDQAPMPRELPRLRDAPELAAFLAMMRNDLEGAAMRLQPDVARVKSALSAQPGCLLSRMSGSGATCFGLFADPLGAAAAAATLRRAEPGWWVVTAPVRPS